MKKVSKKLVYCVFIFIALIGLNTPMYAAFGSATHQQVVTHQQKKKLSFKERIALKILKKRIKKAQKKAAKQQQKPTKTTKTNGLFSGLGKVLLGAIGIVLGALLLAGGILSLNLLGFVLGLGLVLLGAYGIVKGVFHILV